MPISLSGKRIFVAGHKGMVGSAIVRRLETENVEILVADRTQLDLVNQASVTDWFAENYPDIVVIAAAKVGGIFANDSYPADFLYENLMIASNVIEAAHRADINRLLFLGSSCIYPKEAPQPIPEEALLTGLLEPTNEWYAIAKIAGIKLAQAYRKQHGRSYISGMPTNLYGPGDNFDLAGSHVLPALLLKAHNAKLAGEREIGIWGTGRPRREFLHVDDCADACVFLLQNYDSYHHVNIGSGTDISISALAELVCEKVGLDAALNFDTSKPDGTFRKLMDSAKLAGLGWTASIDLEQGIASTYKWFLEHQGQLRGAA